MPGGLIVLGGLIWTLNKILLMLIIMAQNEILDTVLRKIYWWLPG